MTEVEFAGKARGQFLMARGVRQGCPANGFLFAMTFDPVFRFCHDSIIPSRPRFSATFSLTTLSLAFEVVYRVAGLNLNHSMATTAVTSCHELLEWVTTNRRNENSQVRQICWHYDRT